MSAEDSIYHRSDIHMWPEGLDKPSYCGLRKSIDEVDRTSAGRRLCPLCIYRMWTFSLQFVELLKMGREPHATYAEFLHSTDDADWLAKHMPHCTCFRAKWSDFLSSSSGRDDARKHLPIHEIETNILSYERKAKK